MIAIKTKSTFIFYIIVFALITVTTIGFVCCEHKSRKTIKPNKRTVTIEYDKITIDTENDKDGDTDQAVKPVSLGEFKLTAYCACEKCCGIWAYNRPNGIVYGSTGEELNECYSIAVDPDVIPYGTEVIISGHIYKAQDCGGGIKGNEIDVYFEDHDEALNFGVQYAEVFLIN